MAETQHSVGAWIAQTFPGTDPESPRKSLRALEEMVELCLASGASAYEVHKTISGVLEDHVEKIGGFRHWYSANKEPDKIPAEAADVLIVLYGVAHTRGFDLHAEVDKKMTVNRARKWAPRGDGTWYHVKES